MSVLDLETKYKVVSVPMKEIFSDADFNCRGAIAPIDVLDLAKDVAERGLDQPIVLQPWDKPPYQYRIVAGHRRHMAFRVNKAEFIPAYIRDDLDETAARLLNLRENVLRRELNILQEARGLSYFLAQKKGGRGLFTEAELGDIFGQSRGWVQIRKDLLSLPPDIQAEAASGLLTANHIKQLVKMSNEDRYAAIRKIKDRKIRGESTKLTATINRPGDVLRARRREPAEIAEMLDAIYDLFGPNLATRCLAWAAGNINTAALYQTLAEVAEDEGVKFKVPQSVRDAITGVTR
jgi:ParB/RepB/Spo0J family partition protein